MHIEAHGSGPDLVLIHGWAMHGGVFAGLLERLGARFRVHVVDLPGHGLARGDVHFDAEDSAQIHHSRLTRAAAEDVFRTLATEPIARRRHNPGLEPGRVDVIVGGAIVVVAVMRHWGFDELLISEADILDGLARSIA